MILRLLALVLAAAAALLSYEFFISALVAGSHLYMHAALLLWVLPGTTGIVLAVAAMRRLRWELQSGAAPRAEEPRELNKRLEKLNIM